LQAFINKAKTSEYMPCGRPTKSGSPCNWLAGKCPHHGALERRDMQREDAASRKNERGICGVHARKGDGTRCQQIRGECSVHAEEGVRCQSTVDADLTRRCYNRKIEGKQYCADHVDYPNLSKNLREHIDEIGFDTFRKDCQTLGEVKLHVTFFNKFYPHSTGPRPDVKPFMKGYVAGKTAGSQQRPGPTRSGETVEAWQEAVAKWNAAHPIIIDAKVQLLNKGCSFQHIGEIGIVTATHRQENVDVKLSRGGTVFWPRHLLRVLS